MTHYDTILVGATALALGYAHRAEAEGRHCAVIEAGCICIPEVSAAWSGKAYTADHRYSEGAASFLREMEQRGICREKQPAYPEMGPLAAKWFDHTGCDVWFLSRVTEVSRATDVWKLTVSTIGGSFSITSDRLLDTTPDFDLHWFFDESAPKGRLILPQQLTIRDILDKNAVCVTCQVPELSGVLESFKEKPKLVITDSQVFGKVSEIVPRDIMLTSFSILMARYKGDLDSLVKGANKLKDIKDGDKILISEGCTHHRQCNDIGTVKMPGWIREYTGAEPEFSFTSGGEFPSDLSGVSLVVHCGGCMLNEKEMKNRMRIAEEQGVPMVNYGVAIAKMHGILDRSLEIFSKQE